MGETRYKQAACDLCSVQSGGYVGQEAPSGWTVAVARSVRATPRATSTRRFYGCPAHTEVEVLQALAASLAAATGVREEAAP